MVIFLGASGSSEEYGSAYMVSVRDDTMPDTYHSFKRGGIGELGEDRGLTSLQRDREDAVHFSILYCSEQ